MVYWEYYVCWGKFDLDESHLNFDIDPNGHVMGVYGPGLGD